jgi:hypothetical protein
MSRDLRCPVIPQFPTLKKIEVSDKLAVEAFTAQFSPYSDFNFVSMWSWDTSGEMALSQLNGNLVVRFTDYITGEPFFSFIGAADVDATARTLLEFSTRRGLSPTLKLIPHDVAGALDANIFGIEPEPSHADYILSVERLRTYNGSALATKRKEARRFMKDNHGCRFEALDIEQPATHRDLKRLFALWFTNKNAAIISDDQHEYAAFSRCLDFQSHPHLIVFGLFVGNSLAAFGLVEDVGRDFGIIHFCKADIAGYVGIMSFLMQRFAEALTERGIRYINIEQDLGIEGLRTSKASYAPDHYLKKYAVRLL